MMRKAWFMVAFLLILIAVSPGAVVAASYAASMRSSSYFTVDPGWREKIPAGMLDNWDSNEIKVFLPSKVKPIPVEMAEFEGTKPIFVVIKSDHLGWLKQHVSKIIYVVPRANGYYLAYVRADKDQVVALAKSPAVVSILPSPSLYEIFESEYQRMKLLLDKEGAVQANPVALAGGESYTAGVQLIGATRVWSEFNITGDGVVVGVVDTGVDFTSPELWLDAIARDDSGRPLTIVMDEHLVLTKAVAVRDSNGYLNTSGALVPFFSLLLYLIYGGSPIWLYPIDTDWYVGNITSQSGVYRIGIAEVLYLDPLTRYIVPAWVPVIVVDTQQPGVYDTVIMDYSTGFYDFCDLMRQLEQSELGQPLWREPDPAWQDNSFADEPWASVGNEILGRDFDGDGIIDFGLGIISGYYIDSYGFAKAIIDTDTGTITPGEPGVYPGLDSDGEYFAVYTDWYGHGTSVATIIAARGRLTYDIYFNGIQYRLKGVAPGSKLAAATGFLFGSLLPGELWLAGYDIVYVPELDALMPVPAANHRADILSNSWSYVNVAKWAHQYPGDDYFASILDEAVMIENYFYGNNVTIVFAAGNEGPGYGSVSSPGAGLLMIEVGASTLFDYYQLFGYNPGYADDIIPFSSRGPTGLGYPRPDVVNIGAFEWAGVRTLDGRGYGVGQYTDLVSYYPGLTLFSGTSEATPFTSGVVALIYQAYRVKHGYSPDAVTAKVILKSSAKDIGYPAFQQGSGRADAYAAVKLIMEGGVTASVLEGVRNAFIELYTNYWAQYGIPAYLLASYLEDTAYYTVATPGSSKNFTIVLRGDDTVTISAYKYKLVKEATLWSGVYYFNETLWLQVPRYYLYDVDYLEVFVVFKNLTYPPGRFYITPSSDEHLIRIDALDWIDNGDGIMSPDEMWRFNTEARAGTNALITIGDVQHRVRGQLLVRLRYYKANVTPVEAEIILRGYKLVPCGMISVPSIVDIGGYREVVATLTVPEDAGPGVVSGKIVVSTSTKDIVIPFSILVPLVIDNVSTVFLGGQKTGRVYDPYTLYGLIDPLYGRLIESHDYRILPFIVTDPNVAGIAVIARWSTGYATDFSYMVVPPGGTVLPDGRDQSFAGYKFPALVGFVYNPSIADQYNGRLQFYIPIKWVQPLRDFVLYYHYSNTSYDYIFYYKEPAMPGVYRLIYTLNSFSGWKPYDVIGLRIITIRTSSSFKEEGAVGGYIVGSVTASFRAGAYAPFLLADVYMVSNPNVTTPVGIQDILLLGVILDYNGTAWSGGILYYANASYIGITSASNRLSFSYPVIMPQTYQVNGTEIETILVLYEYPWHASGYYIYNTTTGTINIEEMLYPGIVTAQTTVTIG